MQGVNPCLVADKFKCGQNHDGADDKSPNEYLAKKFEEMYDLYQGVAGKDFFSVRNYRMGQWEAEISRILIELTETSCWNHAK